ncbi:MAG: DUF3737 family protein [Oscillospiraceae bacterium]|nr:DUF3737 family protein [Oscillospiraceae bacterium]
MSEKREIRQQILTGERALFASRDLAVVDCIFADGESPLKESAGLDVRGSMFRWKYPLWYCKDVTVRDTVWFEMARAGVWYTEDLVVSDCMIEAPKNFRRCRRLTLENVRFSNAAETLWQCSDVTLDNVAAKGDYFAMNCSDVRVRGLSLFGNYSFDGAKNVTIEDSKLLSKDSFWNSENVTVKNSFISGEYLGWNAKDLTLIGCTIESLQGLCYIENLVMRDCRLINTTLAFEYSSVDAELTGRVDSVLNPSSGRIVADEYGEVVVDPARVDPSKTQILRRGEARQ